MLSAAETNLHAALLGLEARWDELEGLLEVARDYSQEEFVHGSLCRATAVLLCAHMEGALKAVSMAAVADINDNDDFAKAPGSLKRAFVRHVLLESANIEDGKVSHAADVLRDARLVIDEKKLFAANHNPKATVIERYASHFGVTGILGYYSRSRLEDVFASDEGDSTSLIGDLRTSCLDGVSCYPYKLSPAEDFALAPKGKRKEAEGLFGDYLNAVLANRHEIAHGNELKSVVGMRTLQENVAKLQVLVYGYVQIIGHAVASQATIGGN